MDLVKLQIEKKLSIAHSVLWEAARLAESLSDQGLADDLYAAVNGVGLLNLELLGGKAVARPPRI